MNLKGEDWIGCYPKQNPAILSSFSPTHNQWWETWNEAIPTHSTLCQRFWLLSNIQPATKNCLVYGINILVVLPLRYNNLTPFSPHNPLLVCSSVCLLPQKGLVYPSLMSKFSPYKGRALVTKARCPGLNSQQLPALHFTNINYVFISSWLKGMRQAVGTQTTDSKTPPPSPRSKKDILIIETVCSPHNS